MPLGSRPDFGVHLLSLRALFSLNNMAVEKDRGGGRSCSQLLKGSFNFTFNRKIKISCCISKSFPEKSGHSMVRGSFIMIGIMSLDTHIIKYCLVGLGKQPRELGFLSFTKCCFLETTNCGGFRKRIAVKLKL